MEQQRSNRPSKKKKKKARQKPVQLSPNQPDVTPFMGNSSFQWRHSLFEMARSRKQEQQTLPAPLRSKMERGLGADFSQVRLVSNSEAARQLNAKALTKGDEIHFAPGMYRPQDREGQELIGHELQHVVQQREGRVDQPGGQAVNQEAGLEAEARQKGRIIASQEAPVGENQLHQLALQNSEQASPGMPGRQGSQATQLAKLEDFHDGTIPTNDPGRLTDTQIRATDEYQMLMAQFVRGPMKYMEVDVLLACRLAIRDIQQGKTVNFLMILDQPDEYMERAWRQNEALQGARGLVNKLEWVPFNSGQAVNDPDQLESEFAKWLLLAKTQPSAQTGKLNCWELLMFSAFQRGLVSEAQLRAIYTEAIINIQAGKYRSVGQTFEEKTKASSPVTYQVGNPDTPRPLPGDVVVLQSAPVHACIATGVNKVDPATGVVTSGVISLWTPNGRKVENTTIEALDRSARSRPILFWSAKW